MRIVGFETDMNSGCFVDSDFENEQIKTKRLKELDSTQRIRQSSGCKDGKPQQESFAQHSHQRKPQLRLAESSFYHDSSC